jgi:arylsulfatase A-like enzyme
MLAFFLAACDSPPPEPRVEAPPPAPPPGEGLEGQTPPVILVSMDALRADRVGKGLTPNLDAFQAESVVFTEAMSPSSWTVPSTTAIFTARWPSRHTLLNKLEYVGPGEWKDAALPETIETWPQKFIAAGWVGAAFTGGAGVSGRFGYGRGFSVYVDDQKFAGMDYSGPLAATWVREHAAERFLLFFHGYDVHGQHGLLDQTPRQAVPDYQGALDGGVEEQAKLREQGLAAIQKPGDQADLTKVLSAEDARFLLAVYDAKVKEADARLGAFFGVLKELGLYEKAVIAVLADHGEEFMEHGYIDHGATVCQHQLHVPLAVRFPGPARHLTVDAPVSTIDVFPTIGDALGVAGPDGADGQSLLPVIAGKPGRPLVFAESDYRQFVHLRAARRGSHSLIMDLEDGQKQLFDLSKDRAELTDVAAQHPRDAYEIEQELLRWMDASKTKAADYLGVKRETIKIF